MSTDYPAPPQEMTWQNVLDDHAATIGYNLNCVQVGQIVTFYPSTQTADVRLMIQRVFQGKATEYPLLPAVPVFTLTGGVGRVSCPIAPGDPCIVLFNDRDLDSWWLSGQALPPNSARSHDFSDGLALVGVRPKSQALSSYDTSSIEIAHPSIKLTGNVTVSTGATGSFSTADGQVVTVVSGIITNIA